MTARTCLILGASGLVGGRLLRHLLDDPGYAKVTALVRRPLDVTHEKLACVVCDLENPATYAAHVPVDDVFCCLGTTIKKAGSQEAFRKVDHDYPLAVARASGASRYFIVTAVGASPRSAVFYNRVKGDVEEALGRLAFKGGLKIFRPSMLIGERSESRPAERVGMAVMSATAPLFFGSLKRYRAIDAALVAKAVWNAARTEPDESKIYEGEALFSLGERA
jgi:uncharacterized protein YbjT (DUF2867 family)